MDLTELKRIFTYEDGSYRPPSPYDDLTNLMRQTASFSLYMRSTAHEIQMLERWFYEASRLLGSGLTQTNAGGSPKVNAMPDIYED